MARQLTRYRIASGFRLPVQVAAKRGSLAGVIRNEIGVISGTLRRRHPCRGVGVDRQLGIGHDFSAQLAAGTASAAFLISWVTSSG